MIWVIPGLPAGQKYQMVENTSLPDKSSGRSEMGDWGATLNSLGCQIPARSNKLSQWNREEPIAQFRHPRYRLLLKRRWSSHHTSVYSLWKLRGSVAERVGWVE